MSFGSQSPHVIVSSQSPPIILSIIPKLGVSGQRFVKIQISQTSTSPSQGQTSLNKPIQGHTSLVNKLTHLPPRPPRADERFWLPAFEPIGNWREGFAFAKAARPTEWARGSQRATRAHPLSGLTALHEVHVTYGHLYRRTWEVKPRQQQRRKSKDPSAKMTSF